MRLAAVEATLEWFEPVSGGDDVTAKHGRAGEASVAGNEVELQVPERTTPLTARLFLALLAFALCTSSTTLAQGALHADADSTTEAEIQALEYHLIDLLQRRDLEAYAPYLAEDYRRVNRLGRVSTKEEVLTEFASPSPAGRAPARQVPSDMDVRVYGDTAILSFVLTTEREGESPVRARVVKVFVRREGSWIMVHNQGTPLE